MASLTQSAANDVNTLAEFLAMPHVESLDSCPPVDVIVLCVNAILPIAQHVFAAIEKTPSLTKTLVLCGGIGHSTPYLYEAVRKSQYSRISAEIDGLPEAQVLARIVKDFYPRLTEIIDSKAIRLVLEDKSTNCGANASETRRLLDSEGLAPQTFIIVQDPTMSLRTIASFQHTYADIPQRTLFLGCPTFTPSIRLEPSSIYEDTGTAEFNVSGLHGSDLWEISRFFDLVMGEIPRLRDDENGYGPKGKGFIAHVDTPADVDDAWKRLGEVLNFKR